MLCLRLRGAASQVTLGYLRRAAATTSATAAPPRPTTWGHAAQYLPIKGADVQFPWTRDSTKMDCTLVAKDFIKTYDKTVPKLALAGQVVRFMGFHSDCRDPELWAKLAAIFTAALKQELNVLELQGIKEQTVTASGTYSYMGVFGYGDRATPPDPPIVPPIKPKRPKLYPRIFGYKFYKNKVYGVPKHSKFNKLAVPDVRFPEPEPYVLIDPTTLPLTEAQQLRKKALTMGKETAISIECFRELQLDDLELWQTVVRMTRVLIFNRLLDFSSGSRIYGALVAANHGDAAFWELLARSLRGDYPAKVQRRPSDVRRVLDAMKQRNPFSDPQNLDLWEELLFVMQHPMPHNVSTMPVVKKSWELDTKVLQEGSIVEAVQERVKPEVLAYYARRRDPQDRKSK